MTGTVFTVTVWLTLPELQPAVDTITEYVPEALTVMDCVVAPVDHTLSTEDDDVNTTLPPEQKVVGPPAVIVGVAGEPGSLKDTIKVLELQPSLNTKL